MTFSQHLWESITPLYQNILNHPFNLELAKGTLEKKRFQFYMQQDAYYLIHFSKALMHIASRVHCTHTMRHFLGFAEGALVTERQLHAQFLNLEDTLEPSLSCLAYTHYLTAVCTTGSIEEAIAAVLPCFWIYKEVGQHIARKAKKINPYRAWIETYSCPNFSQATQTAIQIMDEIVEGSSKKVFGQIEKAFITSSYFEWYFWDDAYKMNIFKSAICD